MYYFQMFLSLFKRLVFHQQNVFRLWLRTLSAVKDGAGNTGDIDTIFERKRFWFYFDDECRDFSFICFSCHY